MWSWTACVSSLQPFQESMERKTKIYEATARNPLSREVIVKQRLSESDEEAIKAMNEGKIMKENPHPNICECLEFVAEGKPGGGFFVYVISPKMPKNLQEEIDGRIRTRAYFTEDELWKLAKQLISVFAFLQEKVTVIQSIAHRDIKPQNILLDGEGNVKVCDFEYAKVVNLSGPAGHTLLGTIPYFSPLLRKALISGEKDISRVSHNVFKSDVYSLGICLLNATIFEIPYFITTLNKLQENINARLDHISKYSQNWVNLLKQMLTVEEVPRPDFITLNRSLFKSLLYADDEPIQVVVTEEEPSDPLQISIKCGLEHVRVSQTLFEEVPCMISLKAREADPNFACYSIDIVAIIDESSSMFGQRIDLVKQTLMKLIQLLGARDRLSIVGFSNDAQRKCPLICCSPAGKEALNEIVAGLTGEGSTNISSGVVMGLEVLEQRRVLNSGASILLFSDGQNCAGPDPLSTSLQKFSAHTDEQITIHAFGYGDDVDSKLLETLSSEGKGVFYHIKKEEDIQNAFALAYANITTVVARNLRVRVTVNSGPVRCSIPLIYTKEESLDGFTLPDITANQQKDMIFMLKADCQTIAKATRFTPVTVVVQYDDNEGIDSMQTANLEVKFVPWVDAAPPRDPSVFINWFRVKGAYCLREARALAGHGRFKDADQHLRNGIELLQSSGYERHEYIATIIRDLEEALKFVVNNTSWQRGGDAHFASISYSHYSQTASMLTMQYSSTQQQRSVRAMNQMQTPSLLSIVEESSRHTQ